MKKILKHSLALAAFAALGLAALPANAADYQRSQLSVGTGVLGFFSGNAPGTSAAWEARYAFSPMKYFALEGGYTGAAGDAPGPGANIATIVEGDVRVNPFRTERFTPYALAGVGWGSFAGTSSAPSDNSTVTIPLGVGADVQLAQHINAGARFDYRLTTADNYQPAPNVHGDLDSWSLTAKVGATF